MIELTLPQGARVSDALAAVADQSPFAGLDLAQMPVGVWGEQVPRERLLAAHDRVELYRPLQRDPKEARVERARAQERARSSERGRAGDS